MTAIVYPSSGMIWIWWRRRYIRCSRHRESCTAMRCYASSKGTVVWWCVCMYGVPGRLQLGEREAAPTRNKRRKYNRGACGCRDQVGRPGSTDASERCLVACAWPRTWPGAARVWCMRVRWSVWEAEGKQANQSTEAACGRLHSTRNQTTEAACN